MYNKLFARQETAHSRPLFLALICSILTRISPYKIKVFERQVQSKPVNMDNEETIKSAGVRIKRVVFGEKKVRVFFPPG